jgi:hypothetical protein
MCFTSPTIEAFNQKASGLVHQYQRLQRRTILFISHPLHSSRTYQKYNPTSCRESQPITDRLCQECGQPIGKVLLLDTSDAAFSRSRVALVANIPRIGQAKRQLLHRSTIVQSGVNYSLLPHAEGSLIVVAINQQMACSTLNRILPLRALLPLQPPVHPP